MAVAPVINQVSLIGMNVAMITVLLILHFLLLLRQSMLLLRPQCDERLDRMMQRTILQRLRHYTFIRRIQLHGGGAALSALPLLVLLPYARQSPVWATFARQHYLWLALLGFWLLCSAIALAATRLQHFNGIAFSSRDAGPADFGRRWPNWPDKVLWLCELGYLGLLSAALCWFLELENDWLIWRIYLHRILWAGLVGLLVYVYWSNVRYLRQKSGIVAKPVQLEKLSPRLYLWRLRLELAELRHNNFAHGLKLSLKSGLKSGLKPSLNPRNLPMAFVILRFLAPAAQNLQRWQKNEHSLSLLSWTELSEAWQESAQTNIVNKTTKRTIELELLLEMQGFLQYLPASAFRAAVRVWGPYYDVQPEFFDNIFQTGYLLYIGKSAGLSPLLQFLQYLKLKRQDRSFTSPLQIAVLQLQEAPERGGLQSLAAESDFWQHRLYQACGGLRDGLNVEVKALELPPQRSEIVEDEASGMLIRRKKLNRIQRKKREAWQSFRVEREAECLERALRQYLQALCQRWQLSLAGLQEACLYRGPQSIRQLVERSFEPE